MENNYATFHCNMCWRVGRHLVFNGWFHSKMLFWKLCLLVLVAQYSTGIITFFNSILFREQLADGVTVSAYFSFIKDKLPDLKDSLKPLEV